jgi:hypothetical protein
MVMSISTVYDAIINKAGTLFPSKQRLHNPYELSDNPELIMKDSWGLKVGSAERIDIEFCNLSVKREYVFILVRQFATVGNKEEAFDTVSKATLEDQQTFMNSFYSPSEIGLPSSIDQIEISNIGGIEFNTADQKKYLFCELTFNITLSEAVI